MLINSRQNHTSSHFSHKLDCIGMVQAPVQYLNSPLDGIRVSTSEEFLIFLFLFFLLAFSCVLLIEDNLQNIRASVFHSGMITWHHFFLFFP